MAEDAVLQAWFLTGDERGNPDTELIVVPRHPTQGGGLSLPPNLVGREQALEVCRAAGGERVAVSDVENHAGTPVYVHSKAVTVDDVWPPGRVVPHSPAALGRLRRAWAAPLYHAIYDPDGRPRRMRAAGRW
ncbi:hypothetical protein FAIPA1_20473 [Frankia sp. AiPs1]|nr:hypothetical protein [Frankia sp. AiPa1]MCL9762204.1 hypothetical protein [Frankia sp. AiPa1]